MKKSRRKYRYHIIKWSEKELGEQQPMKIFKENFEKQINLYARYRGSRASIQMNVRNYDDIVDITIPLETAKELYLAMQETIQRCEERKKLPDDEDD